MAENYSPLFNQIRACQVSLFIGAGFSLKAGAPSCSDICTAICEHSPHEYKTSFAKKDLAHLADEFIQINSGNRAPLINLLKELFKFDYQDLSDHIALKNIPHFKNIFTTNYDSLLEDTYADRAYVVKCNEDAVRNNHGNINIYKLHGDFKRPEDILISQQDYFDFYRNQHNPLIWDIVKSEFVRHAILFIGYSLEDDNIFYLLERIQEASGGNHQPIYLIAPNLLRYKIDRLQKLGVIYYNAYAHELLSELTENIKENIVDDLKRGIVSVDVFRDFCNINNVNTCVVTNATGSIVSSAHPTNEGKHQLTFTTSDCKPDKLKDFEANANALWQITPTLNIPCIEIQHFQLKDYQHKLNGITLHKRSDVGSIRIAPFYKQGTGRIIVPSKKFIEQVNFVKFIPRDYCQITKIDTPIGILVAETSYNPNTRNYTTTLRFNQADKIYSVSTAMHWYDGFSDICSGKIFKLEGVIKSKGFIKFPINSNSDSTLFNDACNYCNNLIDIECLTGTPFSFYDGFSRKGYDNSSIIRAYINKKAINLHFKSKAIITLSLINLTIEDNNRLEVNEIINGISIFERIDKRIVLCGKEFILPYKYTIFKRCQIVSKTQSATGFDFELSAIDKYYFEFYTDVCDSEFTPGFNTIRIDF